MTYRSKRLEDKMNRVAESMREKDRRIAELEAEAWNEHNVCGVCPYRKSLQARVAELEAERDDTNRGYGRAVLERDRLRAALTQIVAYREQVASRPREMRKIARAALAGETKDTRNEK
jgi:uncharacterized protein YciW